MRIIKKYALLAFNDLRSSTVHIDGTVEPHMANSLKFITFK